MTLIYKPDLDILKMYLHAKINYNTIFVYYELTERSSTRETTEYIN